MSSPDDGNTSGPVGTTAPAPAATGDAILAAALAMASRGHPVFPLGPNSKLPLEEGWQEWATTDPMKIQRKWTDPVSGWPLEYNFGVLPVGLVIADLDEKDGRNGVKNWMELGFDFDTFTVRTPSNGYHLYYTCRATANTVGQVGKIGDTPSGIDTRGPGGYVVGPGSVIDGVAYRVEIDMAVVPVPAALLDWLEAPRERSADRTPAAELDTEANIAAVTEYLRAVPPAVEGQGGDHHTFVICCGVLERGVSVAVGLELLLNHWNDRCSPPWDPEALQVKVENADSYMQNAAGAKSAEAAFAGVSIPKPEYIDGTPPAPPLPAGVRPGSADDAPPFSEIELGLRMVAEARGTLRFIPERDRWIRWDGDVWRVPHRHYGFDVARKTCQAAAGECPKDELGFKITRASVVAAVERIAKATEAMATPLELWDADPMLLGTPGGVVDLQTGTLRPAQPDDFITKLTAAAPGGECPTWLRFLARVTNGDAELAGYLQRLAGYALTGSTREHVLAFLHGGGANGKSVLLTTLKGVLGDYAAVAQAETFTATNAERHSTEIAMLHGARLVIASETEEGRAWAEAKVKQLTGGDPITARFMRQDFFTFVPTFKLIIAGNHKPTLRNVDEAMRRRLHLVPFTVTIPEDERDPELPEKLKAEWPGILAWAIAGCLAWQRDGLGAPEAIRSATRDYLADEDSLATWLAEECVTGPRYCATVAALFASWKAWADRAGEDYGTLKRFTQILNARGAGTLARLGAAQDRGRAGIGLKAAAAMSRVAMPSIDGEAAGNVVQLTPPPPPGR